MAERVYFDWNATAPLRPEARHAFADALELTGNASSVHGEGRKARQLIEEAREQVAALAGAKAGNVIFTSGGTEANVTALTPATGCDRLLVSAIEHPSVLSGGRYGVDSRATLPVTSAGVIDLDALRATLRGTKPWLVSVMAANNETGVVQPIREVAEIAHEAGGLLHCDAVQWFGKMPADELANADVVTMSSHKLGGAQGAGAVILMNDRVKLDSLLTGGGQERGRRAGTENVTAIAGFGAAAAQAAQAAEARHMETMRDKFEAGLKAHTPDVTIFGEAVERLPNTTLFALAGVKAETAVIAFDLAGVAVSSGSACSSGKVSASHVLAAMNVPLALARGAIRISLGWSTTETDVETALNAWKTIVSSLAKDQRNIAA